MVKYGIRVLSPVKDDKSEIRFYGDSIDEVKEFLRNNCIYYKFVPKDNEKVDK